jgi:hypothetical protein
MAVQALDRAHPKVWRRPGVHAGSTAYSEEVNAERKLVRELLQGSRELLSRLQTG